MKKRDIIVLYTDISGIESGVNEETGEKFFSDNEVKPFKYAFLRNSLKFKKVIEEWIEILNLLRAEYEETHPKEGNENWEGDVQNYLGENIKFQEFLEEETEITPYTVSISNLSEDVNLEILERLIKNNIIVE